ncbi:NADH-quinone oxidoreductase [Helicobacter enhydrae]|uniref:NADH-quinone oxidoreductase subunit J n=1 Tax=Helicobacter enhydrae TaxID=222136 RepID=A0A1B1U5C4_9HELI|nr:NADH-quinone oxidoreductase subunit J [Helicobacter enhydrae]ANV97931.1 NADH-quinone oxidoreductase [Helicobacter enhydrae]
MELFLFINFASLAILGALGLVLFQAPIYGALSLIVTMVSIAGLYLLLFAKTLFLIQIVVYAGAIMVLSVFVMMFFNITTHRLCVEFKKSALLPLVLCAGFFYLLIDALWKLPNDFEVAPFDFGEIESLGIYLFNHWSLSFEAISLLLTIALIGVIAILKGKNV